MRDFRTTANESQTQIQGRIRGCPPSSRVLHKVAQSASLSLMTDQPPKSSNWPVPATAGGAADACPASAGAIFCGSGGGRGTINTSIQPCLRRRGCCCKCLPPLRGCDLLRRWRRRRWRRRRDALHRPKVPRLRGCNHSIGRRGTFVRATAVGATHALRRDCAQQSRRIFDWRDLPLSLRPPRVEQPPLSVRIEHQPIPNGRLDTA